MLLILCPPLFPVFLQTPLPYKIIINQEVIAVEEDSGDITEKKDDDNEHEDDSKVDLLLDCCSWPQVCEP